MGLIARATKTATAITLLMFLVTLIFAESAPLCNYDKDTDTQSSHQKAEDTSHCCTTHPLFGGNSGTGCNEVFNHEKNTSLGYTLGELVNDSEKFHELFPTTKSMNPWMPVLALIVQALNIAALCFIATFILTLTLSSFIRQAHRVYKKDKPQGD